MKNFKKCWPGPVSGSRREMETWIKAGRIKVNGTVATLGDRVGRDDTIHVDGKKLSVQGAREVPSVLLYTTSLWVRSVPGMTLKTEKPYSTNCLR